MGYKKLLVGLLLLAIYLSVGFIFLSVGLNECDKGYERWQYTKTECDSEYMCGWYFGTGMWFALGWIIFVVAYIILEEEL